MRFLMMVKGNTRSETGAMGKYNEQLAKAGVVLDLSGLHPSSHGARVRYDGNKRTVVDGPFADAKDFVCGYWLIQVSSREEALEWAKRVPFQEGEVELRQLYEDFASGPAAD
jgi:hypothetical protein